MTTFGWSYPPGCSGKEPGGPEEEMPEGTILQEATMVLLMDYDVPSTVIREVLAVLEKWEKKQAEEYNNELDLDSRILSDEYPR